MTLDFAVLRRFLGENSCIVKQLGDYLLMTFCGFGPFCLLMSQLRLLAGNAVLFCLSELQSSMSRYNSYTDLRVKMAWCIYGRLKTWSEVSPEGEIQSGDAQDRVRSVSFTACQPLLGYLMLSSFFFCFCFVFVFSFLFFFFSFWSFLWFHVSIPI